MENPEKLKTLVLIDGKSVFYRGYYAMPNLSTKNGIPTGGVYGFAAMAVELLKQIEPDYVAVAWDKSKTNIRRRLEIYPEYKANRKPAPPDFYEQIPILHELLDTFNWPLYELDDYEADDIIGTLNKQAEQADLRTIMISSDLDLLQLVDKNTELYALKKGLTNLEKFNIDAFEKKFGLRIDQFLDLKSLKGDASDNIPGALGIGEKTAIALLQEFDNLDGIYANLEKIKPAWHTKLEQGKESVEMSKKLAEIWCDAPIKLDLSAMDVKKIDIEKLRAKLLELEFKSLLNRLPSFMNSDIDTSGISELEVIDRPGIFFTLPNGKIVVNDGKTLAEKMLAENAHAELLEIEFDTRIAGFMLDDIQPASTVDELKTLYKMQLSEMKKLPKLYRLAKQIDFPMQNLLAKVEARGVKIDVRELEKSSHELAQKIANLEQEIWKMAGYEFNIASSLQLSGALFDKLALPTNGIKKSIRGYFSTGKKELDKLYDKHPIIEKVIEFREVAKLKSTYTDNLVKLVDEKGYLHTNLRQDVTATGRLSSSNPNLQNIPIRSNLGRKIRRAFVASDGKVLISADYSQFELRLAANLANDVKLIEMFDNDGADIHTLTAAEAFGVASENVTPTQRRAAKVINFGVLYGMSPHGLSVATDMNLAEAKEFITKYFEARKPIRDFLDQTIRYAKENGYVETLFGRRRATPDIDARNFMIRESAKRAAANMPIQGTEADLMKMAMLRVEKEIPESDAQQILQIHDSILMECMPNKVNEIGVKLKQIMENIYPDLNVKLKVDIKVGKSWADL